MPNKYKGIPDLFDKICQIFESSFYEWILPQEANTCCIGQLCNAPVWFDQKKRWYLTEDHYDHSHEENSTWFANHFDGSKFNGDEYKTVVGKYFELEKGENLFASPAKYRPVILLKKYTSDWINPTNTSLHVNSWLCLPLFTYKESRHYQEYVLNDLQFNTPDRIYIPPCHGDNPGCDSESAAQFLSIQTVKEEYLHPLKSLCETKEPKMQRPFKVSMFALKIIMYHFLHHLNLFDILLANKDTDDKSAYELFVEAVREVVSKC